MRVLRASVWLSVFLGGFLYTLPCWAVGEVVTDIQVANNVRTQEDAIRSLAGLTIGDTLEADTLEVVRERLNTSGLFADVNVYWEPYHDGVRVVIAIKDKFPWAPLPTISIAPGNRSAGLIVAHGNLFGRGKRGVIGGRISTADSGALLAYQDPALFGTWMFYNFKGKFQDQLISEFGNHQDVTPLPVRDTKFRTFGFEANAGVAWFRRVKTSVGWSIEKTDFLWSRVNMDNPAANASAGANASEGAVRGAAAANLVLDFRSREHAVLYGNALELGLNVGNQKWGSDAKLDYWKAGASYEHGIRILRRHNLIFRADAVTGERLPMWMENWAGGNNLRGFLYRQFMGDTQLSSQIEYHFPLFSIGQLDLRGLLFSDGAAIWYRKLEADLGTSYRTRDDGRSFLPPQFLTPGFDITRDLHTSAGAGIRFFLRSVAVPLLGLDYGRGVGTGEWRLVVVLGV